MKNILSVILIMIIAFTSCKKDNYPLEEVDESVDFFSKRLVKPRAEWNELDHLCDSMQRAYGIEIIYEYSPRIIAGTTFFMPPQYDRALPYTKIMLDKIWLKPLKEKFPEFFNKETPIEFILAGGFIHFNDPVTTATAAGAGLNAQFYRLGMGGVNNFSTAKNWLWGHIITLYHEHAHQIDHKYGRGILFDRVSQGRYYGIPAYASVSTVQAQRDGFWYNYGGFAPEEDFATGVETIVRNPEAEIRRILTASESSALATKYQMITQKYLDMGMDLHKLHVMLDSVVYQVNY